MREPYLRMVAFQSVPSLSSSLACPFGHLVSVFCCSRDPATRSCCGDAARFDLSDRRTNVSMATEIGNGPSRAGRWRPHACPVATVAIALWSEGTELPRQTIADRV